jgi:flagellar basal-body rod modification protein FlgD
MSTTISTTASAGIQGQQATNADGSTKLGKDEFLKILTTQLQYQDPTAPLDSNAFVAQLAQFSSLEQMQNVNTSLDQLLTLQKSSNQTATVAMVGKDAIYQTDSMSLGASGGLRVQAQLTSNAADLVLEVEASDGTVVRRQSFGAHAAGTAELTWDGLNESGVRQSAGSYRLTVSAVDSQGALVSVSQRARGRITGVSMSSDGNQLLIGDTHVSMTDVVQIDESNSNP